MQGEWSCYRSGRFNGERRSRYRTGQFKRGRTGHVTEVASHITLVVSLMKGE